MKTFIFGIIIGALVILLGILFFRKDQPAPDVKVIEKIIADKHLTDSLTAENKRKDNLLSKSNYRISILKEKNSQIEASLIDAKSKADSLALEAGHLNSPICDSALLAKEVVINHQDCLIVGLRSELCEFGFQVTLLSDKIKNDSLIISNQVGTINSLSCAYRWKMDHKFWAWLFRWKCDKPPG